MNRGTTKRLALLATAVALVAIAGVEGIVFRTWHFATLVGTRLIGAAPTVVLTSPDTFPTHPMTHITPGIFLSNPELWVGVALAAVFLAGAVRLRHYQGPI